MSLNDYVHFMCQKYRVAVAVAMLKSKPKELTVNQYMDKLKDKLNEKMDIDVISINSDDFNFDEEVFNEFNENDISTNENNDSASILRDVEVHKTNETCDVERPEISTVFATLAYKHQQGPGVPTAPNCTDNTYYEDSECNSLNNDNNFAHTVSKSNAIQKEIPYNAIFNQTSDIVDITVTNKARNIEMANKITKNINKHIQNLRNITKEDSNGRKIDNTVETTAKNTIFNNNDTNINENESSMEESLRFYTKDANEKIVANVKKNITKVTNKDIFENDAEHVYYKEKEKNIAKITNSNNNTKDKDSNNKNNSANKIIDTQETIIYTLYDIADNNTHISQSQFDNIQIRESYLYKNRNKCISNECDGKLQDICQENDTDINKRDFEMNMQDRQNLLIIENGQNIEDDINGSQDIIENRNIQCLENEQNAMQVENNVENEEVQVQNVNKGRNEVTQIQNENKLPITKMLPTEIDYIIDRNGNKYKVIQNYSTDKSYSQEHSYEWTSIQNALAKNTYDIIQENKTFTDNYINLQIEDQCIGIQDIDDTNNGYNNIQEIHKDSESELIPFKVVEELNNVKKYLNKRLNKEEDGYLTDSGYRSDSNSRSSFKSVRLSENWLNQSAYSLYAHLTHCSLIATTEDITEEVSQVIGKLIDMLHEEEKYPSFLEEVLHYIETLLENIFKYDSSSENVLLKKEENFQRLCLLNRSIHMLKYTIDKITQILVKVHANLTDTNNLYEIMNIDEAENMIYIFHIIEVLVPKYMTLKLEGNLSQTQSQNDKILKKSTITEIWRKKWNPNSKETTHFEGKCEKECNLIKLAEILNKIVVHCIEGYSLVSFAALQCYNLMQK